MDRIYRARPRGIGKEDCHGCYCCQNDNWIHIHNNCSFFVPSRETGEVIVSLFGDFGAKLDYREREPNWIQVKVGVCDDHLPNLEKLVELVLATRFGREDGPGINKRMIEESILEIKA